MSLDPLRPRLKAEIQLEQCYQSQTDLNLFDAPDLKTLATQAKAGRHLWGVPRTEQTGSSPTTTPTAFPVRLHEDDYPGWIDARDAESLILESAVDPPDAVSASQIQARLPKVLAFCLSALQVPNSYLWGGTIGPNYDCSGLVQTSFAAQGIWLPRDAYQQQAFVQPIPNPGVEPKDLIPQLWPGDLIFFGTPAKVTHVAIYLGAGHYLHSSGQAQGRNGIGIDELTAQGHPVSQTYYAQFRAGGRVVASYHPQNS
jgi:cell wall-associated NlpC family hydrolase